MKAIANKEIKQLFAEKRLLVRYIHDNNGYPCGVAVAVRAKDSHEFKLGVSLVHPHDYEWDVTSVAALPVVQQEIAFLNRSARIAHKEGRESDAARLKYAADGIAATLQCVVPQQYRKLRVRKPMFDREIGLVKAIADTNKANPTAKKSLPDRHVVEALWEVHLAAMKRFTEVK